jgi:uncharacterized protein YjeT (DUF2065 family)
MSDFLVAVGLVAVIEGVAYASAPAAVKRMMIKALSLPDGALRLGGLGFMTAGVLLVWMIRG